MSETDQATGPREGDCSCAYLHCEMVTQDRYDALSARVRELEAGLKKIYDKSQDNWAAAVADGLLHGEKVAVISD